MIMKLFLCIFLGIFSLSCQGHQVPPAESVVVGIDVQPEQFDPRVANDAVTSKLKRLLFSGLMYLDESQKLLPDLAKSVTVRDPLTYEFELRDDVLFHNHKKLTSADVKATYVSMLDPQLASPYQSGLALIDRIDVIDDTHLTFILKKPFLPFLTLMTLSIIPAEQAKLYLSGHKLTQTEIVGSGPFQMSAHQEAIHKISLDRFVGYFGTKAKIKNIVFWALPDATLRTFELIKGRIDLVQNAIPYVLVPELKKKPNLHFQESVGVNFSYLAFNFRNPFLKNLSVRKAIAMAIDRDKIIKYKLSGLARRADSVLNPTHWAYHDQLPPFDYDVERAKTILDEAGFKDPDGEGPLTRFQLVYKTSTNKERFEIVQLIADHLRKIGIGVVVKSYEFGTLYRDIRQGDFDLFSLTWVNIFDPDIYHSIGHSSQTPPLGTNRGFYVNANLDRLLEEERVEADEAKRLRLLKEIQEIFYNDLVYVPLWYESSFAFVSPRLKGYQVRPDSGLQNLLNVEVTP